MTQKSKFAIFTLSGNKEKEKEEKKKALTAVKNMAKGVGYSNYQQKGWDVKAYMAAQKEKDKQVLFFGFKYSLSRIMSVLIDV